MIPKTIHYCWFGKKPKSKLVKKCIDSWKKNFPDYVIKEWNETNFDIHINKYVEEAYNSQKWAFVSDVARIYALYNEGGIYLDTDVKVIKSFDAFLCNPTVFGFENDSLIMTAVMMSEKGHRIFKEIIREYEKIHFISENGEYDCTPNPVRITKVLENYGLIKNNKKQKTPDFLVLTKDYFSPKDNITGLLSITENTAAIHLFDASWIENKSHKHRKKRWKYYKREKRISQIKSFIRKTLLKKP